MHASIARSLCCAPPDLKHVSVRYTSHASILMHVRFLTCNGMHMQIWGVEKCTVPANL